MMLTAHMSLQQLPHQQADMDSDSATHSFACSLYMQCIGNHHKQDATNSLHTYDVIVSRVYRVYAGNISIASDFRVCV